MLTRTLSAAPTEHRPVTQQEPALAVGPAIEATAGEAYADERDLDVDLTDWRLGAACGPAEVEIFFPPEGVDEPELRRREVAAKEICAGCSVRVLCLLSAMVAGDQHGIWGGTTPAERRVHAQSPLRRLTAA